MSCVVVKLLLPGQEDIGHLLLDLPAAREGNRTELSLCDQQSVNEYWSHIPGWGPQLDLPTLILLWAKDLIPLCLGFPIHHMEIPFHMVGFSIAPPHLPGQQK